MVYGQAPENVPTSQNSAIAPAWYMSESECPSENSTNRSCAASQCRTAARAERGTSGAATRAAVHRSRWTECVAASAHDSDVLSGETRKDVDLRADGQVAGDEEPDVQDQRCRDSDLRSHRRVVKVLGTQTQPDSADSTSRRLGATDSTEGIFCPCEGCSGAGSVRRPGVHRPGPAEGRQGLGRGWARTSAVPSSTAPAHSVIGDRWAVSGSSSSSGGSSRQQPADVCWGSGRRTALRPQWAEHSAAAHTPAFLPVGWPGLRAAAAGPSSAAGPARGCPLRNSVKRLCSEASAAGPVGRRWWRARQHTLLVKVGECHSCSSFEWSGHTRALNGARHRLHTMWPKPTSSAAPRRMLSFRNSTETVFREQHGRQITTMQAMLPSTTSTDAAPTASPGRAGGGGGVRRVQTPHACRRRRRRRRSM